VAADWRVREIEFQRICVEQVKSSRSHEGRSRAGPSDPGGHATEICVFRWKVFQKETRVEVIKSPKPKLRRGVGPRSQPMVILEKESSTGASTHKLVLPEVPESRLCG
jgi:hypothetical protein